MLIKVFGLLPLVILIVAVRPFVLIRFGITDAVRIGHLCNTEGYLCLRDREQSQRRIVDFIGCSSPVSNPQLKLMFSRIMHIYPWTRLLRAMEMASHFWTRSEIHQVTFDPKNLGYLEDTESHLRFTAAENLRGRRLLERLGIPKGASWVCLHNRDSAYLDKIQPGRNWGYHNYRDFEIQSMAYCAEELASKGYYVLRMGSEPEKALLSTNSKVIDYANHVERDDFGDVYLLGNCRFYLGSDSGIFAVATIFKRPVSFINFPVTLTPYGTYFWNPTPFILKRALHKEKGHMLSLRELFVTGLAYAYRTQEYEAAGVELISNTAEEIRDLAVEVDDRVRGVWQAEQGDEKLQERFWEIFRQHAPTHPEGDIKARVGAAFLRKHVDLLN